MNRRRLLVVVALAAIATACGTRTPTGHPGAALTAAAYRTAAAHTCQAYRRQVAALTAPTTVSGLRRYVVAMRGLVAQRIAQLRRLRAPASMAAAVRRMDAEARPLVAALDRLAGSIHTGASPRVALVSFRSTVARLTPSINAQWRSLGVRACTA